MRNILVSIFLTGVFTLIMQGQSLNTDLLTDTVQNRSYRDDVLSVQLKQTSWEFTLPAIELGSEQQLELLFDILSPDRGNLNYTLLHCNAQWKLSDLRPSEYLSGFFEGHVTDASGSFNTTCQYMHYRLVFPEEDCKPLISGNYVVVVYERNDPDKILLTRRFYVIEKTTDITATVRQPSSGEYRETGQQVEFSIKYNTSEIRDPGDVRAVVMQNGRFDNAFILPRPFSVEPGKLNYSGTDGCIFKGGNEFRSLDIKSMKYQTENIAGIEFRNPYFVVIMKPDETREYKPYFSKTDLNGGFYVDCEKAEDRHTGCDYVYVHFVLNASAMYFGEDIYVTGGFCDWTMSSKNRMTYNEQENRYEITLLLKQGLYDYCFALKSSTDNEIISSPFEGDYYETENDYAVFVYHTDRFENYDRLAGFQIIK